MLEIIYKKFKIYLVIVVIHHNNSIGMIMIVLINVIHKMNKLIVNLQGLGKMGELHCCLILFNDFQYIVYIF